MNRSLSFVFSTLCCCVVCSPAPCRSGAPPAPTASTAPLDVAGQKLADDDIPGAIKTLQIALQAQPSNLDALHLLTLAYLGCGQPSKAISTAQSALQQDAASKESRAQFDLLLGQARYRLFLENYRAALSQLGFIKGSGILTQEMAPHVEILPSGDITTVPGDAGAGEDYDMMADSFRGQVTGLRATLTQAGDAFQDGLDADPHLAGAHDGLGMVRVAEGYVGEARHEFETELAEHGPSGVVYTHLGELDAQEDHMDDAQENFRRATAFSPHLATPYDDLAALYAKQHDDERAQYARGMALLLHGDMMAAGKALSASSPKTCEMLCAQAQYALTQKRQDDARRLLEKARTLDPQNARVASELGDVEEAQGQTDRALADYKEALDADPDCDSAWYGIGLVYDAKNDKDSAVADYKQALLINPNNPLARLNLAADEGDMGQSAQAASDLREYLQRFPTASNFYIIQTSLAQFTAS